MKKLIWITIFAVAFGLVEAVVVIYLRIHFYPEGFHFPLKIIPTRILYIEVVREVATVVMLVAIGIMIGRTRLAKFGAFMVSFGMWDIFYYFWLYVLIDWPKSILDWDVLFLIPIPWIGPVLAPLLVSLGLTGCGMWIFLQEERGVQLRTTPLDWIVEFSATALMISTFFMNRGMETPVFLWWLFLVGLIGGIGYFLWRIFHL
ncbi:MAG: hypothetical protein IID16_00685 [Candidatus Marinimicrobia bacterium]|nr:hypothetical protein [Candidatus Neomarinimicrobiota bacterium]